MSLARRRSRPAWLQFALAAVALGLLGTAYVAAMHTTLDASRVDSSHGADRRDMLYLAMHAGTLFLASVVGFALGKWLSGLGVAFALLFVVVLGVGMVSVQLSSFEMACHGHNDLVRHWTC